MPNRFMQLGGLVHPTSMEPNDCHDGNEKSENCDQKGGNALERRTKVHRLQAPFLFEAST
jgi:hypothetical protein